MAQSIHLRFFLVPRYPMQNLNSYRGKCYWHHTNGKDRKFNFWSMSGLPILWQSSMFAVSYSTHFKSSLSCWAVYWCQLLRVKAKDVSTGNIKVLKGKPIFSSNLRIWQLRFFTPVRNVQCILIPFFTWKISSILYEKALKTELKWLGWHDKMTAFQIWKAKPTVSLNKRHANLSMKIIHLQLSLNCLMILLIFSNLWTSLCVFNWQWEMTLGKNKIPLKAIHVYEWIKSFMRSTIISWTLNENYHKRIRFR